MMRSQTGQAHAVREFVERAFARVARSIVWRGSGVGEQGITGGPGPPAATADEADLQGFAAGGVDGWDL